ncbi:conserved exported hypothetical protein [Hyella patelloides LEGE 07179]|uniref:Uncharacterized protein n=1 Tax=Hyella patelloides LEGE 07179 TaxID=945734 RepID=A0A563W2Z9_9CYAN|nr:hypothetical protein [Hyella patelloides]VEP18084.1 conserved exported hypothetical protein [Hyella patelloides LEGE 07179]
MVRIIFFLTAILFVNPKIVTAQSVKTLDQTSCHSTTASTISFESDRDSVSYVNRKPTYTTQDLQSDQTNTTLDRDNSPNFKISENTTDTSITVNPTDTEPKIAVAGIIIPSLWWAKEQFDPFGGRLVKNWLTNPQIKQIDLTVNWQLWTLLDYLGRYRFINQFGTVAREYGYSLRIFNQQQQCLALYKYNDRVNPPKWEIKIEGLGEDSLQVEPENGS